MVRDSREDFKTYGNVFDNFTERLLFKMSGQGHFTQLQSTISPGKEANVFSAKTEDGYIAIKIYRLAACNFNKMHEYIRQDPRYVGMPKARRKVIFAWAQREYRNLLKAREVIRVPTPILHKEHIILMELIGHGNTPARMLKDDPPDDPERFFGLVVDAVTKLWKHGLVHGDLSEFNILNRDGEPVFIDFSQATVTETPDAPGLLERDLKNLCRYFKKLGVEHDPKQLYDTIL